MNPLTLNPFQIKAALIGLLIAFATMAGLTAWAFYERSRYFECRATVAPLAAQINVVGDKLTTQSASIDATAAAGDRAVKNTAKLLAEAQRLSGAHAGDMARLEELLSQPAPLRPDGTAKDCRDLWREWRTEGRK